MQEFKINISTAFQNATAETISSELRLVNNYLVYTANGIGGDIVTSFNVKSFLDDSKNEEIATNFFLFLKGNTNSTEFKEIFYDNQKLATTFNSYYNSVIVKNEKPDNKTIEQEMYGTSGLTYFNNTIFHDQQTRLNNKITTLIQYNTGQSYYISVNINLSKNEAENSDFGKYKQNSLGNTGITQETIVYDYVTTTTTSSGEIQYTPVYHVETTNILKKQKLLNGFVDYNFDDSESEYWKNF